MFEKKDRTRIIEDVNKKENKMNNRTAKKNNDKDTTKTTKIVISISPNVYDKILKVAEKNNFFISRNNVELPNISKTALYILENFNEKKRNISLEFLPPKDKKMITLYPNQIIMEKIKNFAEKNSIVLKNGKIDRVLAINYMIINY